jgi:SAM-dependent methyltransferase
MAVLSEQRETSIDADALPGDLPDYAPLLLAFHEEFEAELRSLIDRLPLSPGNDVLDVACGDGAYAAWFGERVGSRGRVTAIDQSPAWLALAKRRVGIARRRNVELLQADARRLPFADQSFDLVWCSQSLYCLSDLTGCLSEMRRVLRPGGILAVLEDDSLHHVMLPLPIDLELDILQAEFASFSTGPVPAARYYIGRWGTTLLAQAGLRDIKCEALAATRQAPLSAAAKQFFAEHLARLRQRVRRRLARQARQRFDRLTRPESPHCLLRRADFAAVCLDRLVWGRR